MVCLLASSDPLHCNASINGVNMRTVNRTLFAHRRTPIRQRQHEQGVGTPQKFKRVYNCFRARDTASRHKQPGGQTTPCLFIEGLSRGPRRRRTFWSQKLLYLCWPGSPKRSCSCCRYCRLCLRLLLIPVRITGWDAGRPAAHRYRLHLSVSRSVSIFLFSKHNPFPFFTFPFFLILSGRFYCHTLLLARRKEQSTG